MALFQSYDFDADSTFETETLPHNQSGVIGPVPLVHPFHFIEKSELLVKISRAIFDDFKDKISATDSNFQTILKGFLETCKFAVQSIEKLSVKNEENNENIKLIYNQLSLEQNAYDLLLKLMDAEAAANSSQNFDSFLTKLFCENVDFRRLLTLLQWSEEIAFRNPTGFSAFINDVQNFNSINNIYSMSAMRGKTVHLDLCFEDGVNREDQDNSVLLNQVLFSLLRCGRLTEARCLVNSVGLPAIGSVLFVRDFLSNPDFTPTDPLHDNYNLAKSRFFCKQNAVYLIPYDYTVTKSDQCIWATLSSSLPTLLSHATTTDDRLWAYLSCGADSLLDNFLLNTHSKKDNSIALAKKNLIQEIEEVPESVSEIFAQIRINESSIYYCLFGYLAVSDWEGAVDQIALYVQDKQHQDFQAHELRFLTHLVLLLKLKEYTTNSFLCDTLLIKFTNLLIALKLYLLVPCYFIHLSAEKSKEKMLNFLQGLENTIDQQEVLSVAVESGFDVSQLCKDVYQIFKRKNKICSDNDEAGRAATEMLRAWRWLSYDVETIYEAIVEANYLLRKLLLHNRIAEALELLRTIPEDLSARVENYFVNETTDKMRPERLVDAQNEYDCYILYFEALNRYNMWQKHVEGNPPPELPGKPNDEHWARLNLKHRTEYDLSMQKAKDCLQKYIKLSESLKKRAMELLEGVLCMKNGWLSFRRNDEDSADDDVRERAADFAKIRDNYFYHIVRCFIELHSKSGDSFKVLGIANLLVDRRFKIYLDLSKMHLQKLLNEIAKSGAALLKK